MQRVLLDTSYILPTLGVDVEGVKPVLERLKLLRSRGRVELYYSDFSLLEALAKAVKLGVPEHVVEQGITAIAAGYARADPDIRAWLLAARLRRDGLRDLIDALIYATAFTKGLHLLTRDVKLLEFLEKHGYPTNTILIESQFLKG
ncbi:hypothetical protein Hbut_0734 [Hyperthermus butylicus DSM 5456]|uniref:PIN domain-containing protein n=1 Tax=Hyperthermus butylicus (strain DSM 5456 / JCM 9403 / PLM1-5) TaxID=415426 RepID=A2BKS7_HYPBU|nr:hypothetical protein Hbut_0734 [Hyperthermus butylicus DSM 5456]